MPNHDRSDDGDMIAEVASLLAGGAAVAAAVLAPPFLLFRSLARRRRHIRPARSVKRVKHDPERTFHGT